MAIGVIKSKGPRTLTQSGGIVPVDTGGEYVANALQRAGQQISQATYEQAVYDQRELGRSTAINMKMRDADGNIEYQDITATMSQVARDAARPVIEDNYKRAIALDIKKSLVELRRKNALENNDDPNKFRDLAKSELNGYLNAIPEEFQGLGRSVIDDVAASAVEEHYYSLTLKKATDEQAVALSNFVQGFNDSANEIAALVTAGKTGAARELYNKSLEQLPRIMTDFQGGSTKTITSMKSLLQTALFEGTFNEQANAIIEDGRYQLLDPLAEALMAGRTLDSEITVNGQKTKLSDALSVYGINDDLIAEIDNVDVRQKIAGVIRTRANQYTGMLRAAADQVAMMDEFNRHISGNGSGGTNSKAQDHLQTWATSVGIGLDKWTSNDAAALAVDPNTMMHRLLVNGSTLPTGLLRQLNVVENGGALPKDQNELRNLLSIFATASFGMTEAGPVFRNKGMSDSTFAFWTNLHNHVLSYGMDSAQEFALAFSANNSTGEDLENIARTRLGNVNKPAINQIKDRIVALAEDNGGFASDFAPSMWRRMETVMKRAYATLPPSQADEYVMTAYETMYHKSDMMRLPSIMGGGKMGRSEFAPEKIYSGEQLATFKQLANKKLDTAMSGLELGKTAFLYPAPQSTNAAVTWQVLNSVGDPVMNPKTGQPMYITSREINRNETMAARFAQSIQERIEAAKRIRANIKAADSSLPKDVNDFAFGSGS